MCFYKEGLTRHCSNKPMWKVSGVGEGLKFKVCDEHLAWGIRLSGYPALIDSHTAMSSKDEDTEVVLEGFDTSSCGVKDSTKPSEG